MKIKPLSAIILLFLLPSIFISCSDSDTYEISTDDTITSFSIDSAGLGKYPLFTIDNIGNKIFNIDSLHYRADTIVNKTFIKHYTQAGYATEYIITGDSAFFLKDTIDLSKTMALYGGTPLRIKSYAADGYHMREYQVEVRIHQVDPDTILWKKRADSFSGGDATGNIKAITLNDEIFIYESNTKVYSTTINDGDSYTSHTITTLPVNSKMSSVISYNNGTENAFYLVTGDNKVYTSTDGITWDEHPTLSGDVISLLGAFPDYIVAIKNIDGVKRFIVSNKQATSWIEPDHNNAVPNNFPSETSYAAYKSATGLWKMILTGENNDATQTTVWSTDDGIKWDILNEKTGNYRLPHLTQPTVIYYNKMFYAFGGKFESFYSSANGISWNKVDKKVVLPKEVIGRTGPYTSVIDKDNFLWIFWSKGGDYSDEVWKGRINRLGFKIQ